MKKVFYYAALGIMLLSAIACSKKEDSISLNSLEGSTKDASFVYKKDGITNKEGKTAIASAELLNEKTINLYVSALNYELFIKLSDFENNILEEQISVISTEKSVLESKCYLKAKPVPTELKIQNVKIVYTSDKKINISFNVNNAQLIITGTWESPGKPIKFDDVQYEPSLIERLEGRTSKISEYKQYIFRDESKPYESYDLTRMEGAAISFGVVDDGILLYIPDQGYTELFFKIDEYKIKEEDGKIIFTTKKKAYTDFAGYAMGEYELYEHNTNFIYNIEFIYDLKSKEFSIYYNTGNIHKGEPHYEQHPRYRTATGIWDTSLESYKEIKPYLKDRLK